MNKMYDCRNRCLCALCKNVKGNCATCKISVTKTDECLETGIKECEFFETIEQT